MSVPRGGIEAMTSQVLSSSTATGVPALDEAQSQIADAVADGGRHVVHGAPGSGKTRLAVALTVAEADRGGRPMLLVPTRVGDRKSTRLNSSHVAISYA